MKSLRHLPYLIIGFTVILSLNLYGTWIIYFSHELIEDTSLLSPKGMCKGNNVSLMILVSSAVANGRRRQSIRNSWAKDLKDMTDIHLAFLVGRGTDKDQKNIQLEASLYNDIIQEDFHDSYQNLTIKVFNIFKWFSLNCRCTPLPVFFKTDDDMYTNLVNLLQFTKEHNLNEKVIYGSMAVNLWPDRNPSSRWYISSTVYPLDSYPEYLLGIGYLMSGSSAIAIYEASKNSKMFPIEDVYFGGLLPEQMGIKRINSFKISPYKGNVSNICQYRNSISFHYLNEQEMRSIYDRIKDPTIKCH